MTDYKPQIGHRVRVVIEGVVVRQNECDAIEFHVQTGTQRWQKQHIVAEGKGVTVERLPDAEPEWQNGDVVVIRGDSPATLMYRNGRWLCSEDDGHGTSGISADWDEGIVTPVLRGGKPWAEAVDGAA